MKVIKFSVIFVFLLWAPVNLLAQGDFFWSSQPLNSGAINSAATNFHQNLGETGTLFLYYDSSNSELEYGCFLDVATSVAGVVNITNFETFDFNIQIGNVTVDERWTDNLIPGNGGNYGPGTVAADGQSASVNAFTITGGTGIVNANTGMPLVDQGYDFDAEAFIFGRLDYETIGTGSTDLVVSPSPGCPHATPTFGAGTVIVTLPEPISGGILMLSLLGIATYRRQCRNRLVD